MGLREHILNDPVSMLELRELIAVPQGTTVRQAIVLMQEKALGCVVAVDENGKPVGKFTERVLVKILLKGAKALDDPVESHMARAWAVVNNTDPISKVLERMQSRSLRFVVVLDDQGKAIALTGQKGVMEYIVDHFPRQVKVQRMQSKVHMDQREGA